MAEIQSFNNRKNRGGIRSKKLSTRVDLTPMVDLGFLLITFFIFTTTMSEVKAMRFIVPDDRDMTHPTQVPESKTISLILKENNTIDYYFGNDKNNVALTNYSSTGIRSVLLHKIKSLRQQTGKSNELIVLIKPTVGASYKNIIDVLDEMLINNISKYALVEE